MQLIPFRATYPQLNKIDDPEDFFGAVKQDYREFYEQGYFYQAEQPAFYIYQIQRPERSHTGLIANVAIKDFLDGKIRQHEHTLSAKEEKQMLLLHKRRAAVKPVLLTYPAVDRIRQWLEQFVQEREAALSIPFAREEVHKCWPVASAADIAALQQLFSEEVPVTYIADGHHRTSTAARMYQRMVDGEVDGPFESLFAAFFPDHDIEIRDFNRVITYLNDHTPVNFLAHLSKVFEIDPMQAPACPGRKFELTMHLDGGWYRLRWKEHILLEYADEPVILDAMLLDHKVMAKVLGIEDVRNDQRVKYVEGPKGIDGLLKQVNKAEECVAFCLYPVQMEEVMAVADIGQVLPPKSTWFEPRLKNGVLVREY